MNTKAQAARFLMQASLGYDQTLLDAVAIKGIAQWIDDEIALAPPIAATFQTSTEDIWSDFRAKLLAGATGDKTAINGDGNNPALPYKWYFHMAWWEHTLKTNTHILRQRVAQALSEILVISDNSGLERDAIGMASYYDLLYKHAFGNYNELLFDVSLHPCMGVYLTHMNNRKEDLMSNIHPDENYAREIMQLFTIGLFELNSDGTRKKVSGKDIPSYKNSDIQALARVFTGFKAEKYKYEWPDASFFKVMGATINNTPVMFEDGIPKAQKTVPFVDMVSPMVCENPFHDWGAKSLLTGSNQISISDNVSPGANSGILEVKAVIDRLVANSNTAPFIARKLINQLVTSNPSDAYVQAVAAKFGSTGNLGDVVKEILTYPLSNNIAKTQFVSHYVEAGGGQKYVQSQKLKSPLLRVTQLLKAFDISNTSNKFWLIGDDIQQALSQHPLSSPTVFNFYKPDFTPHGPVERQGLVAPEFELHTSATSIAYVNTIYDWIFGGALPAVSTKVNSEPTIKNIPELDVEKLLLEANDKLELNFSNLVPLANAGDNHDGLIERIGLLLTGKNNLLIKSKIKTAFTNYKANTDFVIQTIIFMIIVSAEYSVQEA